MTTQPPPVPVDIFNEECNFFGAPTDVYNGFNDLALQYACGTFASFGCCGATGIALASENQLNVTKLTIFPPCLLNYLQFHCPGFNLNNMCSNGSIADQAVVQVSMTLNKTTQGILYINVYDTDAVLQGMGIISLLLQQGCHLGGEPYNFRVNYPFQVQLIGYIFYDGKLLCLNRFVTILVPNYLL